MIFKLFLVVHTNFKKSMPRHLDEAYLSFLLFIYKQLTLVSGQLEVIQPELLFLLRKIGESCALFFPLGYEFEYSYLVRILGFKELV